MLMQNADVFAAFFFRAGLYQHVNLENDHLFFSTILQGLNPAILITFTRPKGPFFRHYFAFTFFCGAAFSGALRISAANSGSSMVWSRSGPVETIPIFAPLSRSRKRRYSCAFFGRSSKPAALSVDFLHPGIFS